MITWVKNNSIYILVLFLIGLYTFIDIKDVFYQQDEWHALGSYFAQNSFLDLFNVNLFKALMGEGRIFSSIIGYLILKNFPFQNFPLALYSLVLHFVNSLLTFQLALKLIGKKGFALIAAIFFLVCSVSAPTVSWYSTSIGTLPATTMILLSVWLFLEGLNKKRKYLISSFIILFLSQPFKEIGYFLFLFLPISAAFLQKLEVKNWLKNYWYFIAAFLLVTIYRITQLNSYSSESDVFTQTSSHNFFLTISLRAILYPFTSFSLIFFPSDFLLRIAKVFTNHYYPFFPSEHYNMLVESAVLDLLALSAAFLIILFIILVSLKSKIQLQKNIIFIILLIISTFLPYIIFSKTYAYLDSRYYYLAATFSGILLGFLIMNTTTLFKNSLFRFAVFSAVIFYLTWMMMLTKSNLEQLANLSIERRNILNQLSQIKPKLDQKNIFYITGNKHYYLAHDNFVPFQQGVGYTILTWYSKDDNRFKDFLEDEILWDLGSQGYFEDKENGFGYFWDKDQLLKTLKEKNLSLNNVSAFYYDSEFRKLISINPEKI